MRRRNGKPAIADGVDNTNSNGLPDKTWTEILLDKSCDESLTEKIERHYSAATDWRVGLERTQRIFLGLDDEPMPFDESSVAEMLKTVASNYDGLSEEFMVLHAVANALLGVDDDFKMKLTQKKRDKYKPPNVNQAEHVRRVSILHSVANLEKKGWKTEAAIARMQERFGISRAAVFADIKAAEDYLKSGREMFGPDNFENPRSNHSEN